MARRPSGAREEMIHCEYCGEDYAASYKRCPFCDGRAPVEGEPEGEETGRVSRGGSRRTTNTRGGGYGGGPSPKEIVGTVLCISLIIAAICIVISFIKPLIDKSHITPPDPTAPQTSVPSPNGSADPNVSFDPNATPDPNASLTPGTTPVPTIPAGQTATGFTLNKSDFSMSDKYPDPIQLKVTFTPAGSTGTITWTSSNPDVATVDDTGKVSHGTKSGSATITASLPGGITQECIVRCNFSGAAASTGGGTAPSSKPSSSLSLNHTDFSFSSKDEPSVQMKVSGTSSTPTWSIADTNVATISSTGVVKPVGTGHTTITCTVDGQTLTCIVRCRF